MEAAAAAAAASWPPQPHEQAAQQEPTIEELVRTAKVHCCSSTVGGLHELAVQVSAEGISKHQTPNDMAMYIREELDKMFGVCWQCVVVAKVPGCSIGVAPRHVSEQQGSCPGEQFVQLTVGEWDVVIFSQQQQQQQQQQQDVDGDQDEEDEEVEREGGVFRFLRIRVFSPRNLASRSTGNYDCVTEIYEYDTDEDEYECEYEDEDEYEGEDEDVYEDEGEDECKEGEDEDVDEDD